LKSIDTKTLDKRPAADVVNEGKRVLYEIAGGFSFDTFDGAKPRFSNRGKSAAQY
jgi:hypothetical protein